LRLTRGEDRPNDFGLLLDDLRITWTTAATAVGPVTDNPAVSHHPGYSPLDRLHFILAWQLIDEIFDADVKRTDKVDGVILAARSSARPILVDSFFVRQFRWSCGA
jgi:hypothetical protein